MKTRPILFSSPMVQSLIAGRKTQTRRTAGLHEINQNPDSWKFICNSDNLECPKPASFTGYGSLFEPVNGNHKSILVTCHYGEPGGMLWVRENWAITTNVNEIQDWPARPNIKIDEVDFGIRQAIIYQADGQWQWVDEDGSITDKSYWKPSIHMPRTASRFLLKVKNIRAQRIASISNEDCIAEGIEMGFCSQTNGPDLVTFRNYLTGKHEFITAYDSFRSLWQSINGTPKPIHEKQNGKTVTTGYILYPFDKKAGEGYENFTHYRGKPLTVIINPWVWAVDFEQIKQPNTL